jgi:DNA-binding transcriptional ArsR family regulator
MQFDYIDRDESLQFAFIRIPKALVDPDGYFRDLSNVSKMLYGLLLDRMSASMKNHWLDEQNRAYIIYPIKEMADDLGVSPRKTSDYLAELEKIGLVEKKHQGQGKPDMIYVKNFAVIER